DIGRSLSDLGAVQLELGEYEAARRSLEEALAIQRRALIGDHPDIANTLLSLGVLGLSSGVDVKQTVTRLLESTDITEDEALRLAVAQAEAEQLTAASETLFTLHLLIGAALTTADALRPAYSRLVHVKGSVTARQRWGRRARDAADPVTAMLLD